MDRIKSKVKTTLAAAQSYMNPDRLSYIQLDWQTGRLTLGSNRPNSQWVELAHQTFNEKSAGEERTLGYSLKTQEDIRKVYDYLLALEDNGHTALLAQRESVRANANTWSQTLRTQEEQAREVIEHQQHMKNVLHGKYAPK